MRVFQKEKNCVSRTTNFFALVHLLLFRFTEKRQLACSICTGKLMVISGTTGRTTFTMMTCLVTRKVRQKQLSTAKSAYWFCASSMVEGSEGEQNYACLATTHIILKAQTQYFSFSFPPETHFSITFQVCHLFLRMM